MTNLDCQMKHPQNEGSCQLQSSFHELLLVLPLLVVHQQIPNINRDEATYYYLHLTSHPVVVLTVTLAGLQVLLGGSGG